ncbi:putative Extracellular solute-binding protein family 1 [Mesorhizobium metallidurans STM 2683]|uniref:Putative Extracellular solute-binding protein family 1 n=1 Tax=Mesorhizobium metallidurans STM 2683 TaxID=1297569 RepID=M5EFF9_9HYPH|nr:extracellular solute-binding protein [Mesorhizobium metallidurans]CCV03087.1 putative Extracellular solute-binding protein family 1 [Mesorhizobium metallidurans STM 2683]
MKLAVPLLALAGILVPGFMAAGSAYSADDQTLSVSFSNPAYQPVLEEAGRQFEKDHPSVKISFMTPVASHGEHLARTLRLAVTGGLQDVSFQGYDQIATLARKGIAIPLDEFIAAEDDWKSNGLTSASMDAGKVGGKTYALPFESGTPTLFFNLDLVRRAGGDPNNLPRDWEGIIALANKIHGLGDNITGAFFDYNTAGNWTFQALMTGQGGRLMSDDRTIAFDGPEGRKAFSIIRRLGETGMVDMSQDQVFQAFGAGQIGILTQANSYLATFEKKSAGHFKIKAMRWPLSSEDSRIPIGGRSMIMLTKDPKKQKLAWDFMKLMVSPTVQTRLVEITGTSPVNTIAVQKPEFLGPLYANNPNQRASIEALPFVTGWYTFPGDNAARIVDVIRDHLRNVAINRGDVNEELSAMSADVKKLLP